MGRCAGSGQRRAVRRHPQSAGSSSSWGSTSLSTRISVTAARVVYAVLSGHQITGFTPAFQPSGLLPALVAGFTYFAREHLPRLCRERHRRRPSCFELPRRLLPRRDHDGDDASRSRPDRTRGVELLPSHLAALRTAGARGERGAGGGKARAAGDARPAHRAPEPHPAAETGRNVRCGTGATSSWHCCSSTWTTSSRSTTPWGTR